MEIKGLPVGMRVASISLDPVSVPGMARVALEVDNVYGWNDLSTCPIEKGWQRKGEDWFRIGGPDEFWVSVKGNVLSGSERPTIGDLRRIIVERVPPATKKVLVVEMDIGPPPLTEEVVKDCINNQIWHGRAARIRIEERPAQ